MTTFFAHDEPFEDFIRTSLPEETILSIKQNPTGWTNVVVEVVTGKTTYFFRFPRNPFWSKAIIKDAAICKFIKGKTSFKTPDITLCYDTKSRPFTMHQKIDGHTLASRIHHLSHQALVAAANSIAAFIKELSALSLHTAEPLISSSRLSDFLHELDYKHYVRHIDQDHELIKSTETDHLVHGDLNISNILLDNHDKVIGIIDFGFAGIGNPQMDIARVLSRPVPATFQTNFLSNFSDTTNIDRLVEAWHHIDAGYADHIRTNFPEIALPELG